MAKHKAGEQFGEDIPELTYEGAAMEAYYSLLKDLGEELPKIGFTTEWRMGFNHKVKTYTIKLGQWNTTMDCKISINEATRQMIRSIREFDYPIEDTKEICGRLKIDTFKHYIMEKNGHELFLYLIPRFLKLTSNLTIEEPQGYYTKKIGNTNILQEAF